MARLLVIDNYDSFTYNLVQMFRRYPLEIGVFRSDRISLAAVDRFDPAYILISPGPRDPAHAGVSIPVIAAFHRRVPILGVCLGMQCMNEAFGGTTVRAPVPMHGKTSPATHGRQGIFRAIPSPFTVARYHSLAVRPSGDSPLQATAHTPDGVIMGLSHPEFPLHGVQFHPESFLTENGFTLIENFRGFGPLGDGAAGKRTAS